MMLGLFFIVTALALHRAYPCNRYSTDELSNRLNTYSPCFAMEKHLELAELLLTSTEMDEQIPFSIALFSQNHSHLEEIAQTLSLALFNRLNGPEIMNVDILPNDPLVNTPAEIQSRIQQQMAQTLSRCPDRSLFVFKNMQQLSGDTLPVVDVFIPALAGHRNAIQSQDEALQNTGKAIFIFLFDSSAFAPEHLEALKDENWRDVLEQLWQHNGPTFTPSAIIGRISHALVVQSIDSDAACPIVVDPAQDSNSWSWSFLCFTVILTLASMMSMYLYQENNLWPLT